MSLDSLCANQNRGRIIEGKDHGQALGRKNMARNLRIGLSFFSSGIISAAARGALKTPKTSLLSVSVARKQLVGQINRAYCHHR